MTSRVKRARYFHEPFDCHVCGALVKALEEFDFCSECDEPIHKGCGEIRADGNLYCPGCGLKENEQWVER